MNTEGSRQHVNPEENKSNKKKEYCQNARDCAVHTACSVYSTSEIGHIWSSSSEKHKTSLLCLLLLCHCHSIQLQTATFSSPWTRRTSARGCKCETNRTSSAVSLGKKKRREQNADSPHAATVTPSHTAPSLPHAETHNPCDICAQAAVNIQRCCSVKVFRPHVRQNLEIASGGFAQRNHAETTSSLVRNLGNTEKKRMAPFLL